MANGMSLVVLYESMAVREVTATELSKMEGYILQDEIIDVSKPDEGIFWDRACIFDYKDESMKEQYQDKWMKVYDRICVVPPYEMPHVLGVWVKGVLTLIRDENAPNDCKLKNVFLDQQGITAIPVQKYIDEATEQLPSESEVDENDLEAVEDDEIDDFDIEI